MPLDKSHQMDFAGLELIASEFTGVLNGTVNLAAVDAIVNLTDNSAGTADNTVAAMPAATAATTDTSAASLASVNTTLTAIRNNVADLTAKVNELLTALKV